MKKEILLKDTGPRGQEFHEVKRVALFLVDFCFAGVF